MANVNKPGWLMDLDGDELQFQTRTLHIFAILLLAIFALVTVLDVSRGRSIAIVPFIAAALGIGGALWCLRLGQVRLAWSVLLLFVVVSLGFNILNAGGLFARQFPALLIAVVVAGRMLGPRWALLGAGMFALFVAFLGRSHLQGEMATVPLLDPPVVRATAMLMQFLALGILCWYIFSRNADQIVRLKAARMVAQDNAEEAQRARAQFEIVFRANPSAMAIVRKSDGIVTDCNGAMLQLLDRRPDAVLGCSTTQLGLPALVHGDAAHPSSWGGEFALPRGAGDTRLCALRCNDMVIDGAAHLVVHLSDLTQRKQAERALFASEQRFQDFARASGDWFWESDAQGRFVWISDAVESITGMTVEDYRGKTRLELAPPGSDAAQEPWKSHLQVLARREPFRDFLYCHRSRHGDRWLSTSGVPIVGADRSFRGYRGIGSDVTARVAAEDQATLANSRLRAAVEELSENFLLCDAQDRIVIANRRFRESNPAIGPLLERGGTYAEFLQMACASGYYPEAVGREQEFIAARLAQRRSPGPPVERRRGDGVLLLVSDLLLPDGGIVTMALDITARRASELRLAESEASLRAILDNAPGVAVQQFDVGGRILYWNQASAHLFGYGVEEAIGRTLDQLFWTKAENDAWLRRLEEAAARGAAIGPVETAVVHRDGGRRFILYSSFAIPEPGGSLRYVCMDVDITARKQAEEELRRSERLLEQVINAIPLSIFAKDTQSNYIMANNAFLQLNQMTKEQLIGAHTSRLNVPEESRRKSLQDDQWVFTHRRTLDQPETLLQDPSGRRVPMHSAKIPLLDEDGNLVGLLGVNRDTSAEKQAQEVLRASEARFSALFHHSLVPQVVSLADALEADDVNQAFVELSGYPPERLIGAGAAELALFADEGDRDRLRQVVAQGATTVPIDLTIVRSDGARRAVLASAITIATPGGTRLAWSFSDVTDQRAAQRQLRELNQILERSVQQRTEELTRSNAELQVALRNLEASQDALLRSEKLAALGRIVAGVAHELNTPIGNGLLAASTLAHTTSDFVQEVGRGLRRSALDTFVASATEASAILLRNLERAAELVRSFKQVAVDQTTSHRRTFDLCDVIHEVALAHRPALRDSGAEILLDIPVGITLDSYPGPLGQVVANLVNNAVLHAYGQGAAGSIDIAARAAADGRVVLTVTDHGEGISARDLGRIFDPFFTTRLGRGGSGLGLNIVHNVVHGVLGGVITVASTPGQGTCFTISLPLVAPWIQEVAPEA